MLALVFGWTSSLGCPATVTVPRLGRMLQLAVITPRANNDPTVSVKSLENVANLHARI
jgi:hypothetical protein